MTSFLDDLERELRAAHPRRRRAARRAAIERGARRAPAAVATVAVLGGATAFVVSTGDDPARHSAAQTGAGDPGDRVPAGTIAVMNGTRNAGMARAVSEFLRPRHRTVVTADIDAAGTNAPTTVYFERGHESEARALAREAGFAWARMTERVRDVAGGAQLAVEVREDVTGGRAVALTDPAGRRRGTLTTLTAGGTTRIEIEARIEDKRLLGVWLRGPDDARFLGFVAAPVEPRRDDPLVVAELPEGDRRAELVVSRERSARVGEAPRRVLLTARLPAR